MKKQTIGIAGIITILVYTTSFSTSTGSNNSAITTPAQLGFVLFRDSILSADYTVSCSSCHKPEFAFADTSAFSKGVGKNLTARNTPTAMYLDKGTLFFWDGRARTLEQQASMPITNHREMNLPVSMAVKRLNKSAFYQKAFTKVFGRLPDSVLLVKALAEYERTLVLHDSPYDHFLKGDDTAMSEAAIRGFNVFFKEKTCANSACHIGINFGADSLVNIGIYSATDKGLYDLTKNTADIGKFKTPSLRNVGITAPYMHNGIHKTLREVVDYYNNDKNFPVGGGTHPSVNDQRAKLNEQQVSDLVEFLKALTDYKYLKGDKSY